MSAVTRLIFALSGMAPLALAVRAGADIEVAGILFDDDAFADAVVEVSGDPIFERIIGPTPQDRIPTTAEDALLGHDLASSTIAMNGGQSVAVSFTDNAIFNGPGADLVIFETFNGAEGGWVQVVPGGTSIHYDAVFLGQFDIGVLPDHYVNAMFIDLDDFGFAPGELATYVRFTGETPSAEIAAFGALNSIVPAPGAAVMLVATGLIGRRRRR